MYVLEDDDLPFGTLNADVATEGTLPACLLVGGHLVTDLRVKPCRLRRTSFYLCGHG